MLPPRGRRAPGTPDWLRSESFLGGQPQAAFPCQYLSEGFRPHPTPTESSFPVPSGLRGKRKILRRSSLCPFRFRPLPVGPCRNAILSSRQSHNPSNMYSLHSCRDGKGSSILVTSRGAAPSLMERQYWGTAPSNRSLCWLTSPKAIKVAKTDFFFFFFWISFLKICRSGGLSSL